MTDGGTGPEIDPHAHPADQAVPGPRDRVPGDWQRRLH